LYIKKDILKNYKILEDKFEKKSDKKLLYSAFSFAYNKSKNSLNLDWELIIIHVINTAIIANNITKDLKIAISCLLHHSLILNKEEEKEIENTFWKEIFKMLQWIINITKINYKQWELAKNPTLFNHFLKISWNDIRVFLIKICSRLDFIENYNKLSKIEKKRISIETLEVYIPLMRLFGINKYIKDIEDLCYRNIKPKEYNKIEKILWEKKVFLENKIENLKEIIENLAIEYDIEIKFEWRIKSIYSLAKKIETKKIPISSIYDLIAVRIITNKKREAYAFLWLVHSIFKSKENRIKDYISSPKPNGYQSIHTTVVDDEGYIFEIQIQTKQMYEFNIFWIASHNLYKWAIKNPKSYPEWMKKITNSQKIIQTSEWIIDLFQNNFVSNNIVCITPTWDRIEIPKESTILDFAFKIHTSFWKKLKWAYINWEYINDLVYILKNEDQINLDLSEKETKLKIEYLSKLKSKNAKKSLIYYFKSKWEKKVIDLWKYLLNERIELLDYKDFEKMPKFVNTEVLKNFSINNNDKLYYWIWIWNISLDRIIKIINNLKEEQWKYKTTVKLVIKFKNKNYQNINLLFNVFNNLNINIINIEYKWILTTVEINVRDLETLNEVIVEISRLPNIYNVKRIFSTKMKKFIVIFSLFAVLVIIHPFILLFLYKTISISEIIFQIFFYINIGFFISVIYLLKYIANHSLPGLISQSFFWKSLFWLNTAILITTLLESIYIFKEQNSILLFSFVILLYWLTLFEYLDTKFKNKIK